MPSADPQKWTHFSQNNLSPSLGKLFSSKSPWCPPLTGDLGFTKNRNNFLNPLKSSREGGVLPSLDLNNNKAWVEFFRDQTTLKANAPMKTQVLITRYLSPRNMAHVCVSWYFGLFEKNLRLSCYEILGQLPGGRTTTKNGLLQQSPTVSGKQVSVFTQRKRRQVGSPGALY